MKWVSSLLILCVAALLAFGLMMLYSISPVQQPAKYLTRQLVAAGLGIVAAVVMSRLDYRRLRPLAPWLLGLAAVLLLALLIPGVGHEANGARRWFRFRDFQFQPSDFAKLAVLLALADYAAHCQRLMQRFRQGVAVPGVGLLVVAGLIFAEPDWGTALLLTAVCAVVMLLGGVRWSVLALPALAALIGVSVLLAQNPRRSERVYSWLHLEETKDGVGYQAWQARIGIGNGGVDGVGLNQSLQKYLIPENHTDFVFAVVAEEFGYAGSLAVIAAFTLFFVCGLMIAWRAADTFGFLLAAGISFLIGLQALINIGVVSGALPNKGLALPFLSYGGSNLVIMLFCVGVLLSVARVAALEAAKEATTVNVPAVPATYFA